MKKIILTVILLTTISASAFAALSSMRSTSLRAMAMGNAFTAVADDYYAIFANPAGLCNVNTEKRQNPKVTIFGLPVGVSASSNTIDFLRDDLTNILNMFGGGEEEGEESSSVDPISLITSGGDLINGLLRAQGDVGVGLPLGLSIVTKNFGLALGGDLTSSVISYGDIMPRAKIFMDLNYQLKTAIAFRIPISKFALDIGVGLKGFAYAHMAEDIGIDTLPVSALSNGLDPSVLFESAVAGFGAGLDLGANFHIIPEKLRVSFVVEDLVSPLFKQIDFAGTIAGAADSNSSGGLVFKDGDVEFITPNMKVGVAYLIDIKRATKDKPLLNITLAAEMNHLFQPDYGFWRSLCLGAEVQLISLLSVRAGLNGGYPTLGAGLHLKVIDINYTFYQEELGSFEGAMPRTMHYVDFAFRFGEKPKDKKDKDNEEDEE